MNPHQNHAQHRTPIISKSYTLTNAAIMALALHCAQAQSHQATESTQADSPMLQHTLNEISTYARQNAKLDELNRNTYTINKHQIQNKGYTSLENVFSYAPFASFNNAGLGSNIDLRGQGARANTSVQVLINGVYANMLDSSHGVTPLNTLSPASIESIEILPGGGAVMYGNGTRGGVVNISTQKRYEKPYFSAGLSYANIIASTGNNYNADAKFGTKIGDKTYLSLGAAYIHKGGPRVGDLTQGGQGNLGLIYDMSEKQSLSLSVDYFNGVIATTPNNSFMDIPSPDKSDRNRSGNGSMRNTQQRLDVSLGYIAKLSEHAKLDIKAFYHLNNIAYVDSITRLSHFNYNGLPLDNASANQSGSTFSDSRAGLIAKYDLKHTKGRFIAGVESIWNQGKRTMDQRILWNGSVSMPAPPGTSVTSYDHKIFIPFTGTKWSSALYGLEKYDFTDRFSLTGGARYEFAFYDIDVTYKNDMSIGMSNRPMKIAYSTTGALQDTLHNYALELVPSYRYRDSGAVYAKYEKGFFSPSPNSMLKRSGSSSTSKYTATDLRKEEYHTFEVGVKDVFGEFMSISAAAFYTLTQNEFYTIGNAHSLGGVQYRNYDLTQRTGVELFSQQFFFNDILHFSESFTYVDARILQDNGSKANRQIPYTSSYKATLGASLALGRHWNLWTQHSFFGAQKDIVGGNIPAYSLSDIGVEANYGGFSLSAGVRNVFDSFYYTYYNSDKSDPIAGYGFLIGAGRTLFVQGRYSF